MMILIILLGLSLLGPAPVANSASVDDSLTVTDSLVAAGGSSLPARDAPVVLSGDTLFYLHAQLGPFSPPQRASAVTQRCREIIEKGLNPDSLRVVDAGSSSNLVLGSFILMSVTDADAAPVGKSRAELAGEYADILREAVKRTAQEYSFKSLLTNAGISLGLLIAAFLLFWLMTVLFPKAYSKLESWEGTVVRPIKFRSKAILSASTITAVHIILLKAIRLILSLAILYFLIITITSLFPWTRSLKIRPILQGLLSSVLVTVAAAVLLKGAGPLFRMLTASINSWRGTVIKAVKVKTIEVLSADRIADLLKLGVRILNVVILLVIGYFYITLLFSFFDFTRNWSATLFGYILVPLGKVLLAFVGFLPNLFFIIVIIFVTRYVIKFIRLFFTEIDRGKVVLPGFYQEWGWPTYKIVRFLVLVFAAIIIFPYLPGSDSPFFKGISLFLGILFSLGSTSAIANVVAGLVLTYMRPFKIGDRVKIADTVGDVIEKTLLVTRVRTIKNVDVTIPNAMVMGSHIINFSTSASERGLILHTGVTIGYDAPWRKVHELLISAAQATEHIVKDPAPFILQTSLDDFYVSYELNAYTDQPNLMAKIYSDLHQNIQDKFNEAGVEITSPHYAAARDGNRIAIPDDYLPKGYQAPAFRIWPIGGGDKNERSR